MDGSKKLWACWGRKVNVQENHSPNMKQKVKIRTKGEKIISRIARRNQGIVNKSYASFSKRKIKLYYFEQFVECKKREFIRTFILFQDSYKRILTTARWKRNKILTIVDLPLL